MQLTISEQEFKEITQSLNYLKFKEYFEAFTPTQTVSEIIEMIEKPFPVSFWRSPGQGRSRNTFLKVFLANVLSLDLKDLPLLVGVADDSDILKKVLHLKFTKGE